MIFLRFLFFSSSAFASIEDIDIEVLKNLFSGVYVECEITRMCAWMSESWLESKGIFESDVEFLSLADPVCYARDVGSLEGLPMDLHFWIWCSEEIPEEHENSEGHLAHYDCGTETTIHR